MEKRGRKIKEKQLEHKKKGIKGITLIALVITIIVLLILAGVSIATLTGENGILTKAQRAKEATEEASIKEGIQTEILASFDGTGSFNAEKFKERMKDLGEEVTEETEEEIIVEKDGYEAIIDAKTGEIKSFAIAKGVRPKVEIIVKEYLAETKKVPIEIEVTNEVGQVDSIELKNLDTQDTYEASLNGKKASIEVEKNGSYQVEVKTTTDSIQKTGIVNVVVSKIPVEFTKAQGKIDIIWVNKANQKIEKPLAPLLNGMKKVYWKDGEEIKEENEKFIESEWYSYEAGNNKDDSKTSKWANAINTVDDVESYFVWIPRYAYRIIYTTADGNVAGYCDGEGTREVAGEKIEDAKTGITTVAYNGFKYIVHPAFETNINNGGWDQDLSGIWVGKYEASNTGSDKVQVVPGVASWRNESIGSFYTKAFDYDHSKESHLIKNSEWGACAYLTYSQYGRNGHEVSINSSSSYITGSGNGTAYNSEDSRLASSSGNEYGVYDLNGGTYEYVAAFNDIGSNLSNGSTFAGTDKESTKYATKYSSKNDLPSYDNYYSGDATYEVYVGSSKAWNGTHSNFTCPSFPFFRRGNSYGHSTDAGVFFADDGYGSATSYYTFRVVVTGD